MKKFEDLTPEEKKEICNGCGGKGGWIKPPHAAFFEASCNHHDYGYWKGNTKFHRKICDKAFFEAMKRDCGRLRWWNYIRYRTWCSAYYKSVRMFGAKYFYFADKQRELF